MVLFGFLCLILEGQEDQAEVKELRGTRPSCFKVPWSSWPSIKRPYKALEGFIRLLRAFKGFKGPYKDLKSLIRPLRAL